ncbi:MAG: F0F1 ATP synthase subunit A [Oscillospiraceae bacterium]|nr:F0F1 ATP synthase subunit A [Oscillospiraceae bacterium]
MLVNQLTLTALPKILEGPTELNVEGPKVIASFAIGSLTINFTETIILEWIVMAVILGLCIFLTRGLKVRAVSKRQVIAEMAVEAITNLVRDTMGKRWLRFTPYIATIFCFSIFGSLVSLLGVRAVTSDFSVLLTWAAITFILITWTKLRFGGVRGYLKGFADPIPVMLPINILSEVATPTAMALRHFGNIAGGSIIMALVYYGLANLSRMIHLKVPVLTVGIPAVLSLYFDLFSDFMQAFIFIMLTMVFISNAGPAEEEPA